MSYRGDRAGQRGRGRDRGAFRGTYRGRGQAPTQHPTQQWAGAGAQGGAGTYPGRGGALGGGRGGWTEFVPGAATHAAFDRGRGGFGDRGRGQRGRGSDRGRFYGAEGQSTEIDSRLEPDELQELVSYFSSLDVDPKGDDMPVRPDWGTLGTSIKLRSNFFPISLAEDLTISEYEVIITPDVSSKKQRHIRRRIFHLLHADESFEPYRALAAHDSSAKLYAADLLPQPLSFDVPFYYEDQAGPSDKSTIYHLELRYIKELDVQKLRNFLSGNAEHRDNDIADLAAALNLILAQHPSQHGLTLGRSRFFSDEEGKDLGGGLEIRQGYYNSVRPTVKQLMANVNVTAGAFYTEGNLANQMMRWREVAGDAQLGSFVPGLRVVMTPTQRRMTINGMVRVQGRFTSARTYKIKWEEGKPEETVQQYLLRKYGTTLQYPDLPLVAIRSNTKWENSLPPEVLQILPDQHIDHRKLTDKHVEQMISHTQKPPHINVANILNEGLPMLGITGDDTSTAEVPKSFGISVDKKMTVVPGRILTAPHVFYSNTYQEVDQPKAAWNLRDVRFLWGADLRNWAVLVLKDMKLEHEFTGRDDPALRHLIRGFMNMCAQSGLSVSTEPYFLEAKLPPKNAQFDPLRKAGVEAIRRAIVSGVGQNPLELVLVILSSQDRNIYAGLKKLFDVSMDIHSVCVQTAKIRDRSGQKQYFANVALKFNTKLGGVNHCLDADSMGMLLSAPTMVVGMDVTHPGQRKDLPSIAAVVANIGDDFAQYPCSMRLQGANVEMIQDLEAMMIERLQLYVDRTHQLPARILVYRDGVSEGQFKQVIGKEMPSIISAFSHFGTDETPYRPQLTIITCGKRHNTRFYPVDRESADAKGNARPGTVVDQGVTAIYNFDFYLQAHSGIQGTTRPTHYFVLHDEVGFTADELQKVTNDVCYMFMRATRAVSLASPAYYADLACERGRCYLNEIFQGGGDSSSTKSGEESEVLSRAARVWQGGVCGPRLKDSMFYL